MTSLLADQRPKDDTARFNTYTAPVYPESLIYSFSRGFVSVSLTINQQGRVTGAQILRATHPDFVAPTFEALKSWRFEPALRNGLPITTIQVENIWFDIRIMPAAGSVADYFFGLKPVPSKESPEEFKYEKAADVLTVVNPVYPYNLAVAGTKGRAQIEFVVDENGTVTKTSTLTATNPELGEALEAMAQACHINPARKNGKPQKSLMRRLQIFGPGENYLTYNDQTKKLIKEIAAKGPNIALPGELDTPLNPLYQTAPVYPPDLQSQGREGEATIEFFIDHNGQAQLPRILAASDRAFGWAAATAVQQWVFTKPTKRGKPVFVRVQIPMEFKLAGQSK